MLLLGPLLAGLTTGRLVPDAAVLLALVLDLPMPGFVSVGEAGDIVFSLLLSCLGSNEADHLPLLFLIMLGWSILRGQRAL